MQKIIVSDPDYLMIKAFQTIISKNNYFELLAFTDNNLELLNLCAEHSPDIILMDIMEASHQCTDIVRNIRKHSPTISIYIITSCNDFEVIQKLVDIGIKEYILKPVSLTKMNSILKQHEQVMNNTLVEKFRELVMGKDFNKVYREIPQMEEYLRKEYQKCATDISFQINKMLQESFKLMSCINREQQERYQEKFNFNEHVLTDKYKTQFLLFELFDEVFKQRVIQKKSQLAQYYSYVDKHIYQDISFYEVAEACDISQGYLSRVLKENYNLGFNLYIQFRKIQLAKQSFYYNDDKIIDVSFQLAYSESSYFCKVFKKIENITPTQLKKEIDQERIKFRFISSSKEAGIIERNKNHI